LLGAFALRVHALGAKSLWYDELRQVEVAQLPITQLQPLLLAHAARPLDYVLTHFWLLGGHQEFWLRFPALLWSTLAVAAAFALGRLLLGHRAALAATALLAASALGVEYAQELRPYALYLLIALLSFYCLERALAWPGRRGRRDGAAWAGFAAASALGTLTHFFYAFLLAAQTAYGAGALLVRRPTRWRELAALAAASALGFGALAVAAKPVQLVGFAQSFLRALGMAPAAGALVSTTGAPVAVTEVVNADFFLKGLLPPMGGGPGPAALLLFNGLALAGLILLAVWSGRRLALVLIWLALAPGLIIVYLQYRQQFFALRYILFALPIYLMLIAYAVARLWPRPPGQWAGLRRAASAGLLASLLLLELGQVWEGYRTPKDDWRRVGQFLTANTRPGDTLGAPDVQAFIRFYAPSQTAAIVDANDLGPHQEALANGERFWFVWSEYTLLPVDETRQWALKLPGVTFELDPRIKVIFVHPGLSQAEMLREAQSFTVPPPSIP
jgi:uncharacterized membrane protein